MNLPQPISADAILQIAALTAPELDPSPAELAEQAELVRRSLCAYFENYITDCPGYTGPVIAIIWPASPGTMTTFIQRKNRWAICNQTSE